MTHPESQAEPDDSEFLKHWDSVSSGYGHGPEFTAAYHAARAAWFASRRAALPPVAATNSNIPTKEELRQAIYDKVSRAEDLMTEFPPHNAVARYHEASKTLHEVIENLFPDSTTPGATPQPPEGL